jgi:hypothetical protein
MSKKAFEGIMHGLQEAIAYVGGDERTVARVAKVKFAGYSSSGWKKTILFLISIFS